MGSEAEADAEAAIGADLYWLPLGAGGHVVRWSGKLYEQARAVRQHRQPRPLFHTALIVRLPETSFVIEQVPAAPPGPDHGVVCTGPVGVAWPGRRPFPLYEVHCWACGTIIDVAEAVASPVTVTSEESTCRRMVACLADLPVLTWGRDELRTGEMWNSNSITAWVLARSGVDAHTVQPPDHGLAPGWSAGLVAEARRGSSARRVVDDVLRTRCWSPATRTRAAPTRRPRAARSAPSGLRP